MASVYEAAGGIEGLRRLAGAWHARVLSDELVSHAFSHGYRPDHTERLAAYWAEALGGPTTYSDRYGDETSVVRLHSGNGPHDEMNVRAIACFDLAIVDAGLAPDERVRRVLHEYFEWATMTSMSEYEHSADDVPDGLRIPRWSWGGLVTGAALPESPTTDGSVGASSARYDTFADWYVGWVSENPLVLSDPALGLLADDLGGQRWLDVACGPGRMSRELARRGASVLGVDCSSRLVAAARAGSDGTAGLQFVVGDVTRPGDWWDGTPFDGAVCEMALMDIDDLPGTLAAVSAVVRPGAQVLASIVHPCFPGNEAGLPSWPPEQGYRSEGFWTSPAHNPDGVRLRVGSNHRTLSTYLNEFLRVGLILERLAEPAADVPTLLAVSCQRT